MWEGAHDHERVVVYLLMEEIGVSNIAAKSGVRSQLLRIKHGNCGGRTSWKDLGSLRLSATAFMYVY